MKTLGEMKRSKQRMCFFLYTCPGYTYEPQANSDAYDLLESLTKTKYVKKLKRVKPAYTLTNAGILEIPTLRYDELEYKNNIPELTNEQYRALDPYVRKYIDKMQARSGSFDILKNVIHDYLLSKYQEIDDTE